MALCASLIFMLSSSEVRTTVKGILHYSWIIIKVLNNLNWLLPDQLLTDRLLTDRLLTDRLLTDRLLTARLLVHRLLTARLLTDRLLTARLLVHRLLSARLLTDRLLTVRQKAGQPNCCSTCKKGSNKPKFVGVHCFYLLFIYQDQWYGNYGKKKSPFLSDQCAVHCWISWCAPKHITTTELYGCVVRKLREMCKYTMQLRAEMWRTTEYRLWTDIRVSRVQLKRPRFSRIQLFGAQEMWSPTLQHDVDGIFTGFDHFDLG